MATREDLWEILSDLFVDTDRSEDLPRIAQRLVRIGVSIEEIERVLRKEVAPVAGRWMTYPGAIGPWPAFDREDLEMRIRENMQRPWYRRSRVGLTRAVEQEWSAVRRALVELKNLTTQSSGRDETQ